MSSSPFSHEWYAHEWDLRVQGQFVNRDMHRLQGYPAHKKTPPTLGPP